MLEKTARKPSTDPAQEKLRQDKAVWNKEVSSFINDLIHLKKMMNGWPSKFYKERSRITQPIPADPNTIIGSLAGDFQQLAQRGESIVQEQLSYAKNRRQKQPKAPQQPEAQQGPATPAPPAQPPANENGQQDLSKQLAAWEQKYDAQLIAEGSNTLTRTWTRALNAPGSIGWGSNAKKRRARMDMLKRSTEAYKSLKKLQVAIVSPLGGKESIKLAYDLSIKLDREWDMVKDRLNDFKELAGDSVSPEDQKKNLKDLEDEVKGKVPEQSAPVEKQPEQTPVVTAPVQNFNQIGDDIVRDFTSVFKGQIVGDVVPALKDAVNNFNLAPALGPDKEIRAQELIATYNNLLNQLRTKYSVAGNSLKEIEKALRDKGSASDQLEATAQAILKKWLGKARHSIFPGETSDYRMKIYEISAGLKEDIDQFMNMAESRHTTVAEYEKQMKKVDAGILALHGRMVRLFRVYFRLPGEGKKK